MSVPSVGWSPPFPVCRSPGSVSFGELARMFYAYKEPAPSRGNTVALSSLNSKRKRISCQEGERR